MTHQIELIKITIMKEIKLTTIQWGALLTKALIRNVFQTPKKGQLYFTPQDFSQKDNNIFVYLKIDYFDALYNDIKKAENTGKFRNSNAEEHWLSIIRSFNLANDVANINLEKLQEWDLH